MHKMISAVSFAALLTAGAFAGISAASADPAQDKVISNYCNKNADASDCNDWRSNRANWSASQYEAFYGQHSSDPDFQSAEGQAAFGPPVNSTATTNEVDPGTAPVKDPTGAAAIATPVSPSSDLPAASPAQSQGTVSSTSTGNVVNTVPQVIGDSPNHVADCQATFKSYDAATDTYMGLDGSREKCKL